MSAILTEDEWRVVVDMESDESIARCDETYQLRERVRQLERLNATLATQVDRMRPVIDTAITWRREQLHRGRRYVDSAPLESMVDAYEHQMARPGKRESTNGLPTR